MNYTLHNKELPIPSFFQVYNFGGGFGDKSREIVYAELTSDTPALVNYFYINNEYNYQFHSNLFDKASDFNSVGDLYNHVRDSLIKSGEIYSGYKSKTYDFNSKVFLLDSGAANIVKQVACDINYDVDKLKSELIKELRNYYDFADKLKFDIVVGFDLGGKYTEKDGNNDVEIKKFLSQIDTDEINDFLTEETFKYLSQKKNFYPYVLATVHGATQNDYADCVKNILCLESKYKHKFWGFALGGIASYKQVDPSWYSDINFKKTGKRGFIETVPPARAIKLVRNLVGDRPIHALGCGGYNNIALNYMCGATSFDAASPVRRVGDGNLASTKIVFDPTPSKEGFSKFFMGGINIDGTFRNEKVGYVKLNVVPDNMKLCGCNACAISKNVHNIKKLYSIKEKDGEANYFSRQLIGLHAVLQHSKLPLFFRQFFNRLY